MKNNLFVAILPVIQQSASITSTRHILKLVIVKKVSYEFSPGASRKDEKKIILSHLWNFYGTAAVSPSVTRLLLSGRHFIPLSYHIITDKPLIQRGQNARHPLKASAAEKLEKWEKICAFSN